MTTVYKYELAIGDDQGISMPFDAQVLTVQVQNGVPVLWAKVDVAENPLSRLEEKRYIVIVGTGNPISARWKYLSYIGTFQLSLPGGMFVGHVFEGEYLTP